MYKFCLIKLQSGERWKIGFISFVFRAKFWSRKRILVGKWIISQLLKSSEAAVPLSSIQFWMELYLISASSSPSGFDVKWEAEFTTAKAY